MKHFKQNQLLKTEYIAFYTDCPVQKYAAMYVGKDEDTIIRWRKEDCIFADAVKRAKAEWVRKRLLSTKAEFALERLEKDIFSQKVEINTTHTIPTDNLPRATEEGVNDFITTQLKSKYLAPIR